MNREKLIGALGAMLIGSAGVGIGWTSTRPAPVEETPIVPIVVKTERYVLVVKDKVQDRHPQEPEVLAEAVPLPRPKPAKKSKRRVKRR